MHPIPTPLALIVALATLTAQRSARAQVTPHTRASPATPPPSPAPTRVTLEMEREVQRIEAPTSSARRRFVVGGRRAERTAGGWVFSREMTLGIAAAVETATGWVFVTDDGLVASSEEFTGTLRRLGVVPRFLSVSGLTRGRVAVIAEDGLWTSDGRSLTRHEAPAPVHDCAFVDAQRGVAVTAEGERMVTRDGGATWSFVREGTEAFLWVGVWDAGFFSGTVRELIALRADGARGDRVSTFGARPPETSSAEPSDQEALDAWRQRFPGRTAPQWVLLRDGSRLGLEEGGRGAALVRRDASGQERSRRVLPFAGRLEAWGTAALLRADRDLWRTDDGTSLEFILTPDGTCRGEDNSEAQASDDGVYLLTNRCFYDGSSWREMDLPAGDGWRLNAVRGATALMVSRRGDSQTWCAVDLNTGRGVPVGSAGDASLSNCEFALTGDGLAAGLCVAGRPTDAGAATLVIGRAGSAMASRPAPAQARHVAFVDARRGVATGTRATDLWRTLDGGERWEAVTLPVEGDAEQTTYEGEEFHARCDETGCSVGTFRGVSARMSGWGPLTASEDRLQLGASSRSGPVATLRCETDEPLPQRPTSRSFGGWERWYGGFCQVTPGRDRRSSTLAWEEAGGASGRIALSTQSSGAVGCEDLVAPTRHGGLFRHGGLAFQGRGVLRDLRREFEALLGERARFGSIGAIGPVTATTARGGVVINLRGTALPAPHVDVSMRVVVEFADDGALLAARAFPESPLLVATGVAFHRGRWGYASVLRDRTVRFAPLDEGQPSTLGRLPASLAPCAAPPARGATTAHLARVGSVPFVVDPENSFLRSQIAFELAGDSVCLRALRGVDYDGVLSLAAERGRLTGTSTGRSSRSAVRCEVAR